MKKVFEEFRFFRSQPLNIRTILVTNLLFAMILPIIEIFAGAYIMRNTGKPSNVVLYQLCMYIGVVLAALVNGFLLKFFKSVHLYSFGIIISAVSLMAMMFIKGVDISVLCVSGFFIGLATGFFWTNRYLLTLYSTNDDNRNYFFGFESFFFSFWNIVIPLLVGAFLGNIEGKTIFNVLFTVNMGYRVITVIALIIAICACIVLSGGNFQRQDSKNLFHIKFHILWRKMLALAGLKGMVQGFLVTAPAILVMKFVGSEGSLGLIQGIGCALTAILVYVLGRVAKPDDRMKIFGFGLFVFFIGTLFNGILFSATGVIIFVLCKVLFQPLHDLAYYPTMMKTIDTVSEIEQRDGYTYIMSHEVGLFFGRAFGMILFIVLAKSVSDDFALRFAMIIVGALQLLSLPLAQNIIKDIDTNKYKVVNSSVKNGK
ncbi:MAG: MFS transporter [Bacteroidales bacterium]|nr:MFS transporter [Bacteroidales bacterium]MCI1784754.1 MFS transporter [Bacteroidales bacterium]